MQIKLVFSNTGLGLFTVTAVPTTPKVISPREPVLVQFKNESRFLELLHHAELNPEAHALLVGTITAAADTPGRTACCEAIELTPAQLESLHLASVLIRNA